MIIRHKCTHDDNNYFHTSPILSNHQKPLPRVGQIKLTDSEMDYLTHEYDTESFMVYYNNSIIFEQYFHENNAQTKLNPFSITKSIVSLLIGIAHDEGAIESLDDLVSKYLKETRLKNTTIRDVLQMTSGVGFIKTHYLLEMGLEYFGDNLTSNVLEMKQEVPQGRLFRYSNLNTQLLGVVLEKATGKHLTQYLQEKLWKYISVQDAEWCLDESGNTKSFCCLFMTTEDLLRVGAMILNNGFINNDMIISDTYLQQMFKPNPFVQFRQKRRQLTENTFYGLHAWVTDVDGVKIHYFNGIMGQFMAIVPEWDLVFTRFGNDEKIDTKSTFEPVVRELALIARRMAMSQFE